jgi:uncharacterized surface protein with fasciclin (FAS1) repeats
MNYFKSYLLLFMFSALVLSGCKNKWDDHNDTGAVATGGSLYAVIKATPALSRFADYLAATGYDTVLNSSNDFTVWAPTNAALEGLDTAISNHKDSLKNLVANHICYRSFPYKLTQTSFTLKTLANNFITITSENPLVQGADLEAPYDRIGSNGILHVIDKVWIPKMTIWAYINQKVDNPCTRLKTFLDMIYRDPYVDPSSPVIGTNATTGKSIYDSININKYLINVAPLNTADSSFTYFILTDEAFNSEYTRFMPYALARTGYATDSCTSWLVYKDMAVRGKYTLANMPDTVVSVKNVKMHIDKNSIVKTYEASNGIVYFISKSNIRIQDKLLSYVVEAENYTYATPATSNDQEQKIMYDPLASGKHYAYRSWAKSSNYSLDYNLSLNSFDFFTTNYNVYFRIPNTSRFTSVGTTYLMIWYESNALRGAIKTGTGYAYSYYTQYDRTFPTTNTLGYDYQLAVPAASFAYNSAMGSYMEIKINGSLAKGVLGLTGNLYGDYVNFRYVDKLKMFCRIATNNGASSYFVDYIRFEPVVK